MEKIKEFLRIVEFSNGNGYGNGNGNGDGNGYGDGYGKGYGNGYGNGNGNVDGNGYGYGDGNGYGNGNGNGDGNGYGDGYGNGNGYGDGYGNGDGDGDGVKSLNNQHIYLIDNIQTIISNIKNNVAKGYIVQNDLSLTPCYIVKKENTFSHGVTLKEAYKSLEEKLLLILPIKDRIIKFKKQFHSVLNKYSAKDFYQWHYLLTGSCEIGRKSFIKNKDINLETDKFTVDEFIFLVQNSYGSDVILELKNSYK